MKKKSLNLIFGLGFASLGVIIGANVMSRTFTTTFASLLSEEAYTNKLTLNAENLTTGSGSVVINGNVFNYENITVEGDTIILENQSRIVAANPSDGTGTGLVGAGFEVATLKTTAENDFTGNVILNNETLNLTIPASYDANLDVDSSKFDFAISDGSLSVSELSLTYLCKNTTVNINGKADEAHFNSEVMSKPYTMNANDDFKTSVYATKQDDGLYFYIHQEVKIAKNTGDGWWQKDNFELRFGTDYQGFEDWQLWGSSNGTYNANMIQDYKVVNSTLDNGYTVYDYEFYVSKNYIENTMGFDYEYSIYVTLGTNYANDDNTDNRFVAGAGWDDADFSTHYEITSAGLERNGTNERDLMGDELLTSPITGGYDGTNATWNTTLYKPVFDANESFAVKMKFHSTTHADKLTDGGSGYVIEFALKDESQGITFRRDWWSTWTWTKDGVDCSAGHRNLHEDLYGKDWNNDTLPIMNDMDVVAYASWNKVMGRVSFVAEYTSKTAGKEGRKIQVSYWSKAHIDLGGKNLMIRFGYNYASVNLTSVQLLYGTLES